MAKGIRPTIPKIPEGLSVILTVVVFGIVLSANQWGAERFDFGIGLKNLFVAMFAVVLSFGASYFAKAWVAKVYEAKIRYVFYPLFALVVLLAGIFSKGLIVLGVAGATFLIPLRMFRLGRKAKEAHLGPWETAKIYAAGIIAHFILAIVAKGFAANSMFWSDLLVLNVWASLFGMVPFGLSYLYAVSWKYESFAKATQRVVPMLDGARIFYGSRFLWVFLFSLIGATYAFLLALPVWISLVIGFGIAVSIFLAWAKHVEWKANK